MAGFIASKIKVCSLKFYLLEPGAKMLLEIEHDTLSPGEMYMFLAIMEKGFLSQVIMVMSQIKEDPEHEVY